MTCPELSFPLARATSSANDLVVLGSSPRDRARQIASAMRLAAWPPPDSSPYASMMRTNSSWGTVCRNAEAGTPLEGSKRKSKGPSVSGRKPRLASSNCGEEMPTSRSTPSTEPGVTPSGLSTLCMELNGAWWMVNRASSAIRRSPSLIASGSMSKACSLPEGAMAASIAFEWPPRPKVPSTKVAPGLGATSFSTVSSRKAGIWAPMSVPLQPCILASLGDTLFAGCTYKMREPKWLPDHRTASATASILLNVIHANPRPKLRRGARTIFPAAPKNSASCLEVASSGKFLMKTS
mmetsp:Transcript_9200/g.21346  ORF Transcript_9200/g.21346 Transcript_9200/m.21346 type:complete len:294 (+) Transcript_9200:764-1645(+)